MSGQKGCACRVGGKALNRERGGKKGGIEVYSEKVGLHSHSALSQGARAGGLLSEQGSEEKKEL